MSVPVVYQKILSNDISLDGLSARQRTLVSKLLTANPASRRFDAVPAQNAMRDAPAPAAQAVTTTDAIRKPRGVRSDDTLTTETPRPKPLRKWMAAAMVPASLLVFGLLAFLVVTEPTVLDDPDGASQGVPSGGEVSRESSPECSAGYHVAMQKVRSLVAEGGSTEDARAIEEELSQALGGANILVSADSPNKAKRSLFVVRTALRASLSEGATRAADIQSIFERQDAIARGINAFDESCDIGECSAGYRVAMQKVRSLVAEGGSTEDARAIEEELSQALGGANILVSADSPNKAKRSLFVVRTALRASLSEGATRAADIQSIFERQDAIARGIKAFDEECG